MIRIGLGVFLAAVAMFMWGFLYWAVLANPFTPLTAEGETAIAQVLKDHAKAPGLYMVPSPDPAKEAEVAARAKAGPFAMMHVAPGGVPFAEPSVLAAGFVHMLVSSALLALVLVLILPAAGTFGGRFRIVAAIALATTVFMHFSQPIWWHHSWSVSFVYAAYDLAALLLAGAILSFFVARS